MRMIGWLIASRISVKSKTLVTRRIATDRPVMA